MTARRNPERAAVADPEPKPPSRPSEGAGSSSETKARQSGGCGSAVPQRPVEEPTGKPVSHGQAGGMPALDAIARKVLAYHPQPKSKPAKARKRRAAKAAKASL